MLALRTAVEGTDQQPAQRLCCAVLPLSIGAEELAEIINLLTLPDDWRQRLRELERESGGDDSEKERRRLQSKLRRLRELYLEGDIAKKEYNRRKAEVQADLATLHDPAQSRIIQAGETLESLGQEWAQATRKHQHDMLRLIFEAIYVDTIDKRIVCVKPYPPFVPLFRMDGLEEGENGCFYPTEERTR